MALAFSDLPIITGTISANPGTFLDDLHGLLVSAGWASAVYETGHVYACVSPQGLAVQVRIWDPADSNFENCFAFQWLSSVDPYPEGLIQHLRMDATLTYFVWVNCCSLFIARPGVTHTGDHLPWSVFGGVPWAAGVTAATPQCEMQSPRGEATYELWVSSGSDSGVPGFGAATVESFRSGNHCKRFSYCRNGVVETRDAALEYQALQLGVMRPAGYLNNRRPTGFVDGIAYLDGTPIASDPILSFAGTWLGQFYDSCLLSEPMALEATEQIYETEEDRTTDWVNHMNGVGFTA